jgi:predicted Na+-dependent transporter
LLNILRFLARHGRYALVVGLLVGLLLPDVAVKMKPWLPQLVVFLVFLTALRTGPKDALKGLENFRSTLAVVLVFQLIVPLSALTISYLFGFSQSPYTLAVVLVLTAPATLTIIARLSIALVQERLKARYEWEIHRTKSRHLGCG